MKDEKYIFENIGDYLADDEFLAFVDGYHGDDYDLFIEKQNKINSLLSDDKYINWLVNFKKDYPFYFNGYDYDYDGIGLDDKNSINNLSLFYNGIFKYAVKNRVYPETNDGLECFILKYKSNFYRIGVVNNKYFYFANIRDNEYRDVIEFNDIINNKKSNKAFVVENKMSKIMYLIETMHASGVPLDVIKKSIYECFDEIEERDTCKKLIK